MYGETVMRKPRILMCPPDYYGIEYEINPWMSRARGADVERTHRQWSALRDTLIGLGVRVELMTPERGLPDLVFTANAGLVYRDRFFSSRFRHEVRARETPQFDPWFSTHGFPVEKMARGAGWAGTRGSGGGGAPCGAEGRGGGAGRGEGGVGGDRGRGGGVSGAERLGRGGGAGGVGTAHFFFVGAHIHVLAGPPLHRP